MKRDIENKVEEINSRHVRKNTWQRVVSVLCCIVVFVTTYALILPAFTLEKTSPDTYCGIEAHKHTEECYDDVLVCTQDDETHEHTEACYEKKLVCQLEEHTHTSECLKDPDQKEASQYESGVYLMGDDAVLSKISCGYAKHAPVALDNEEYKDKTIYVMQSEKDRTVYFTDENAQNFTLKNKDEEEDLEENETQSETTSETKLKDYDGEAFALEAQENETAASVTVSKNAKAGDVVLLQSETQNGEKPVTTEIRVVCDTTVTYDLNGGQSADGESQIDDIKGKTYETYALADEPTKDGMFFAGWQAQNKTIYAAGAPYTVGAEEGQTLTAKWSLTKVSINGLPDGVIPDVEEKEYSSDILGIQNDSDRVVAYSINAQDENGEDVKYFDGENVNITVDDFNLKDGEKLYVYHLLDSTEAIKKAYEDKTLRLKQVDGLEKSYPQEAKACAEFLNEVNYSGENGIAAGQTNILAYTVINTSDGKVLTNNDGSVTFSSDSLSNFIFMVETSANTDLQSTGAIVLGKQTTVAPDNFTNANIKSYQNNGWPIAANFAKTKMPLEYTFALGGNMVGKVSDYTKGCTRYVYGNTPEKVTDDKYSDMYGWDKNYFKVKVTDKITKEGYIQNKILYPMPGPYKVGPEKDKDVNGQFKSGTTFGDDVLFCRYKNVGKYVDTSTGKSTNIDVKLSVTAYGRNEDEPENSSNKVIKQNGKYVFNPLIFFRTDKVGVYVLGVSYVTLKYTFLKAGTDDSVKVKGFTTYNDIDGYQGIFLHNNCDNLLCNVSNLAKIKNTVYAKDITVNKNTYRYVYDNAGATYDDTDSYYAAFTECFTASSITRTFTFYDKGSHQARGTLHNSNSSATDYEYGLKIQKAMKAGETFPKSGVEFRITVGKNNDTGTFTAIKKEATYGDITTGKDGVATVTLTKAKPTRTLRNLTNENVIKVQEITPGYTTSATFEGTNKTATKADNIYDFNIKNSNVFPGTKVVYADITNTEKLYTLNVDKVLSSKKFLTDDSSADNKESFKFNVYIKTNDTTNKPLVAGKYGDVTFKTGKDPDNNNCLVGTFTLDAGYDGKVSTTKTISNLRYNWQIKVQEATVGYVTEVSKNGGARSTGDVGYIAVNSLNFSQNTRKLSLRFYNTDFTLKVDKALWGSTDLTDTFKFAAEVQDENGNVVPEGQYGNITLTTQEIENADGTKRTVSYGEFNLTGNLRKFGGTVEITGLKKDWKVKIRELDSKDYEKVEVNVPTQDGTSYKEASEREIVLNEKNADSDRIVLMHFVNIKIPYKNDDNMYGFAIYKEVGGGIDPEKTFTFNVELYNYMWASIDKNTCESLGFDFITTANGKTIGKKSVSVKAGEIVYINNIPNEDYCFRITEVESTEYDTSYWSANGSNALTPKYSKGNMIEFTLDRSNTDPFGYRYSTLCFKNDYKTPGNDPDGYGIDICKELVDGVAPTEGFHFAIDLYQDTNDTPAKPTEYDGYEFKTKTIYADTRKEVDEDHKDSNDKNQITVTRYDFYLKPDQHFIISNIPVGYKAYVMEFADGYSTQVKTNDGEYEARYTRYLTLNDNNTDGYRYLRLRYRNSAGKELPATGGIGVYPFIIGGGIIMLSAVVCAVVLLLKQKRNNKK